MDKEQIIGWVKPKMMEAWNKMGSTGNENYKLNKENFYAGIHHILELFVSEFLEEDEDRIFEEQPQPKTPITEKGLIEKGWKKLYCDCCESRYMKKDYEIFKSSNDCYTAEIIGKYCDIEYLEQLDILINAIQQVETINNE